jgi:hypothetical protein
MLPTHAHPIVHEGTIGGIRHSPASAYAQELAKWETRPLEDGSVTQSMISAARAAGLHHGSFEHHEFPKMLYQATQTPNGIKMTGEIVVESMVQQRNMESRGYRASQDDALALVETQNTEMAQAAAERAFTDRRMTPKAQAEAERIESSTARHLGEIPAAPIKKRRPYTRTSKPAVPAVE